MTFEEYILDQLINSGLLEEQATEVLAMTKADSANEDFSERWEDSIERYPTPMKSVLWLSAKYNALEWIYENVPGRICLTGIGD